MNRLSFLCAFLLASSAALAKQAPPNILFLFADDQRADTIGAWGNPNIRTPHLDRLVAEGMSFRNNYCFGSNSGAVCMPSRAMLMSGRTWFHVDNRLSDPRIPLFPELLRKNGYTTFATGKWHNYSPGLVRAFERAQAVMLDGMADHTKVPLVNVSKDGAIGGARVGRGFSSEIFADAAISFLRGHHGDKPFLCYVAFTAPHDPRQPPYAYRRPYYENRPPLPRNYLPQHPFDNGHCIGGRDENLAPWPRTKDIIRDQLAEYYGLITHLDEQVGRILKALEETGHAGDTIVIYAADHGLAIGSHGLLGKQSVYEHSMKCPLIFKGPGIPRGRSSDAFTYLLDLFPTVCDFAGLDKPDGLEGRSLEPIIAGRAEGVRSSVFLPFQDIQRAVRTDQWKLIVYPKIQYMQLFDLAADPDEIHNLIEQPGAAGHVKALLALMKGWQQRVGDTLALPARSHTPPPLDLTGRPRKPDRWQPDWIIEKYF